MRVAVVGVTGLVGNVMLKVLNERAFPVTELIPVASERSVGKELEFRHKTYRILSMEDAVDAAPDIALFSAGGSVSMEWAPKFAAKGTTVIDNSSAWRMDPAIRLVVPEVNGNVLGENDRIIANPNCSTIQMVAALNPLHQAFGIKRLVISTYQSYTGTGMNAVRQYSTEKESNSYDKTGAYPHQIYNNCIPHCDVFYENGYTREELKLVRETHKILRNDQIGITATAVRVPVRGGHSEAVNVEFTNKFDVEKVIDILREAEGITVLDEIMDNKYPMPLYAEGHDDVYVGRIRRDLSIENGLNMWIVSDNLRKGAATNTIQIAEYLMNKGILKQLQTV